MENQKVLILDFGGQYNQLIARRVRECNVYCEVHPYNMSLEKIRDIRAHRYYFHRWSQQLFMRKALPDWKRKSFEMGIPILGICYGVQVMAYTAGRYCKAGLISVNMAESRWNCDTRAARIFSGLAEEANALDEP